MLEYPKRHTMALIPKITNLFNDIRNKIEPQQLDVAEAHYLAKRQMFSGFDEFNPAKMDSDDDMVDIGIDIVEDTKDTDTEIELNHHKTTTRKVLNFLA